MGIEIERKYMVQQLPPVVHRQEGVSIRQGYVIATDEGVELRVRQKQARYFQTIKMGEGLARTEIEFELTPDQFMQLWPHTNGRRVSKTRYTLPLGDHTAELDRFDENLTGLVLVEVEFPSIDASRQFSPPDWFGDEVTEDGRYKNKHLAVHGIPQD